MDNLFNCAINELYNKKSKSVLTTHIGPTLYWYQYKVGTTYILYYIYWLVPSVPCVGTIYQPVCLTMNQYIDTNQYLKPCVTICHNNHHQINFFDDALWAFRLQHNLNNGDQVVDVVEYVNIFPLNQQVYKLIGLKFDDWLYLLLIVKSSFT